MTDMFTPKDEEPEEAKEELEDGHVTRTISGTVSHHGYHPVPIKLKVTFTGNPSPDEVEGITGRLRWHINYWNFVPRED